MVEQNGSYISVFIELSGCTLTVLLLLGKISFFFMKEIQAYALALNWLILFSLCLSCFSCCRSTGKAGKFIEPAR